jgi:hypothetical protein
MSVYTTKKGQQGDLILHINGNQSICPYVQALPMQGQYGQIQIMRLPCTSSCPHVRLTEDDQWRITCSGETIQFDIQEETESNLDTPLILT